MTVNTNEFYVGDKITFELTTGEKVEAKAVRKTKRGMMFIATDCLKQEYPMFKILAGRKKDEITYENSDLRKELAKIAETFPEEVRSMMKPVYKGDLLRIPYKKELFGNSKKLFKGMKQRRNKIAMQGHKTEALEWYWLIDKSEGSASTFALVSGSGYAYYDTASNSYGVRPVFCLSCI